MSLVTRLFGSGRKPEPIITLEVEGLPVQEQPDLETVRAAVLGLSYPRPTFLCLTHKNGDYLQVVGTRPWCRIERRTQNPLNHECAFQDTPKPKFVDGVPLNSGAGEIIMAHDEWFLLKHAADIFAAFFARSDFPTYLQWRSMNAMFE